MVCPTLRRVLPVLVTQVSAQHAVGKGRVVFQPLGKEFDQREGGLAVAVFDERHELAEALAERVMLLPVPVIGVVARRAHQTFFVQQMVFSGGDEAMQDFENREFGSRGSERLLQFIGLVVDGAMLVIDF